MTAQGNALLFGSTVRGAFFRSFPVLNIPAGGVGPAEERATYGLQRFSGCGMPST
ncbi:hypothetical protein PSAL_031490 [Pseudooceanicola algae]|uniref:Uncharacterized protein n=1 Tax=Pseudooceanicola algae TaxID=1537215 RepID=A0A418SJG3_9RHOB|nr:hypothetical protein PSAL_031490 [Pseudooceanicola algae]